MVNRALSIRAHQPAKKCVRTIFPPIVKHEIRCASSVCAPARGAPIHPLLLTAQENTIPALVLTSRHNTEVTTSAGLYYAITS